jgi:hypothetical protein
MSRRRFPFAELILFSGILAGGYTIVAAAKVTATPVAASDRHNKQPTASEAANPASAPAPTLASRTEYSSAKPPVPLRTSRRATHWIEDPQRPTAPTSEATDKKVTSDLTAKAMIEADGYKSVRSLVQAPDGGWRGLAMRGPVEIAVSVDANGRVLAE